MLEIKRSLLSWIELLQPEMVSLQVIPDRTVKNNSSDLARALYEMYASITDRIDIKNKILQYRQQESFSFDIVITDQIRFYLSVPERWQEFTRTKLSSIWPKATIQPSKIPTIDATRVTELKLKNHSFYALHTDRRDYKPLPPLLEAAKELKNVTARIQVLAIPIDRENWQYEAQQAYAAHKRGEMLKQQEYTAAGLFKSGLEIADDIFKEAHEIVTDFLGMEPADKKSQIYTKELVALAMRNQQGLNEATIRKINETVYDVSIRIIAAGETQRAMLAVWSLAAALSELNSNDQELIRRDIPAGRIRNFVNDVQEFRSSILRSQNILSASELGKLMQLPGVELQEQYPAVESIRMRETLLPSGITDLSGLYIGTIKHRGHTADVFMPTSNIDELCLPRVVIGGMGTGKTKGFGGNLIVQAVKKGYTAIAIDPEKGEMYNEAISDLKPEQVIRIRFDGKRLIGLDWREAKYSPNARSRLASNIVSFIETASDETGVQTARFLRSAAKAVPNGKLSEIVNLLIDPAYRQKILEIMPESERDTWRVYHEDFSESRRIQISLPVLNRLDPLTGDDYLNACIEKGESIDFVNLIDRGQGKAIIIDIPRLELSSEAVDVLAALMASKLDIAMVCRKTEHPVFIVQDEPAQYMKSVKSWKDIAVRSRKFRFAYTWMFHAWEQIPHDLAAIIKAAGPHYHIYSSSKKTFSDLKEELSPFTIDEFLNMPRYYALNSIWCKGKKTPAFLAKMAPPPSMRK